MRIPTGSATGERFGARLIVALAVLIVIASQPLPASADFGARYKFYLAAGSDKSLAHLCVDDIVRLDVTAQEAVLPGSVFGEEESWHSMGLDGVGIDAFISPPGVGSLDVQHGQTSAAASPPGSATFKFRAVKAGTTVIDFNGLLAAVGFFQDTVATNKPFLPAKLNATVKDCEYSVNVTSHWHDLGLDYIALVSDVRLTSSGSDAYTGSGMWTLIETTNPPVGHCPPYTQLVRAPVEVDASLGDNSLEVLVTYEDALMVWTGKRSDDCEATSYVATANLSPQALEFNIPSSGSSLTVAQSLSDTLWTSFGANGSAFVTVTRIRPE